MDFPRVIPRLNVTVLFSLYIVQMLTPNTKI